MTCYVFKKKRHIGGKLVVSDNWHGALRMDWEQGQPRVWCLGTTDKREAERRLIAERILKEKERAGLAAPQTQRDAAEMTLNELLEAFLAELRTIGRAVGTIKKYGNMRVMFGRCGWQRIADVTPRSFSEWRVRCGLAPRTVNALLKDTGTFFRWLRRQRMVNENPLEFVRLVDTRRLEKFRRALTEDEVQRLISTTAKICHKRAVVYLLAVYTGLRRAEMQQLTVSDFVLDSPAPFVRVRAATAKDPKESQQRLRPEVVAAVRAILPENAPPLQLVFEGVVPRIPRFKKDLEAAGIPFEDARGRRVDLHALRDTFGTQLAAAGRSPFEIKELMRHSTVQQSEKYYIDATHLPTAAALAALPKFTVTAPEAKQIVSNAS